MSYEAELESDEREALRKVFLLGASCEVPVDFADRVMSRAAAAQKTKRVSEAPSWAAWWIGMIAAAAAIVLALALGLGLRDEPQTDDLADLRADAEQVLLRECTPCHVGEAPGAQDGALAVFDLRDSRWQDGMSSAQLAMVVDRVAQRGDATGVRRYVDAELGRRR